MEKPNRTNQTRQRQQQRGAARPLPAVATPRAVVPYVPPTTAQRVKYSAGVGVSSGLAFALLGAHSFGGIVGLVGGIIAWNCSDVIHARLGGKPGRVQWIRPHWLTWKWWTTDHQISPLQGVEEVSPALAREAAQEAADMETRYFNQSEPDDEKVERLYLGRLIRPPVDAFLSKRVVVLGVSGWGKSNSVAVILEELGRYRVPFLCCDTEGEYAPLCTRDYLHRPYLADASNTTIDDAYQLGRRILDDGLQVVLNLDSFLNDDQGARVMIAIICGMREWQEERDNDERVASIVVLDEAQVWLPENEAESSVSRVKDARTKLSLLDELQQTFFNVVRRGRKRGIGFIFATQKLADIDNRCLQTDWAIYGRQEDSTSLARYKKLGIDPDIARTLKDGQAWVKNANLRIDAPYQIRRRRSPHGANTPGLKSVRARYSLTSPKSTLRPTQEPDGDGFDRRYGRNVTASEPTDLISEVSSDVTRNGYGDDIANEAAPDAAVTANSAPLRPEGWGDKEIEMLPYLYKASNNIDRCLQALDLSTSQRNRDYARELLKGI